MPSERRDEMKVTNATAVVVDGTVQPDGTLEVIQKVNLPAGKVHVTVEPVAEPVQPTRFWTMMELIWAAQRATGRTHRTREEIDSEIEASRNESEEEMRAVERLQEECRRAREQPQVAKEPPH
jgi:hypothetical protein